MMMKTLLALTTLTMLAGCLGPVPESDEAIGKASQASIGPPPPPPPVGYWSFNQCTGNQVLNSATQPLTATLYNGAYCDAGHDGTAGIFDGGDDRAEIPYNAALDFTNAMTVSAWVKPNGTSAPQTIVSKWYAPDSYMLSLSNGSYRFSVALAGGGSFSVAAPATPGVFSHVAGVFDGQTLTIYVDGVATSASAPGTLQTSTRPVTIGNHPSWNAYAGAIDEVRLYNQALSYGQIYPLPHYACTGCQPPNCCTPL